MTAHWKDDTETVWICSLGEEHNDRYCRNDPSRTDGPEERPAKTPPRQPHVQAVTECFVLTLPNHLRVPITGNITIGRSLEDVIGLSFLQYADVSHAHLEVEFMNGGEYLRFNPVQEPAKAQVYYYRNDETDTGVTTGITADELDKVKPKLIERNDRSLDGLSLDRGSSDTRLFGLGQHCMIKFEWGML